MTLNLKNYIPALMYGASITVSAADITVRDFTTSGNTILGNEVSDTLTIGGSTQINGTIVNAAQALVSIGTIVTGTGINVSANTARVAGFSANLYNTANTVTGLRGCDLRVADNGSTGSHPIVGVQGVATKTSGASTSEIWGGNLIAHVNGGKVENAYGVVGAVDVLAAASVGTTNADTNNICGVLGSIAVESGATLSTEMVSAAVIGTLVANTATAKAKLTGGFVAIIEADSSLITAGAGFKIINRSSSFASKFDYGMDLYSAEAGRNVNSFAVADIRLSSAKNIYSGTAITRAAVRALVGDTAPQGSFFIGNTSVATTKPNMYVKVLAASADTDWERVVTAATD